MALSPMDYPCTLSKPTHVIFLGVSFRLMGGRQAYYLSQSKTNAGRRSAVGLHVAIWQHFNKRAMPPGHVCHHRDHNTFNNAPENLEVMTLAEHGRQHCGPADEAQRRHLDKVRHLASAWHASPEGLAWHSQNGRAAWNGRVHVTKDCVVCGRAFRTRANKTYCTNWCNFKKLRADGNYDRKQTCPHCGKEYVAQPKKPGKYPVFCSRSCATLARVRPR